MANLLAALNISAGSLEAYSRALEVTQNNVTNASTPGYVRQSASFEAEAFDPESGLAGGVQAGEVTSARDQYAEREVRQAVSEEAEAQQKVDSFTSLEALFPVTEDTGISASLNDLFDSFSDWAADAGDSNARNSVIERADDLAQAIQQTASGLASVADDTESQLQHTVDSINDLTSRIAEINRKIMTGARDDAGVDAELYSALEELSGYADFTTIKQTDGTVTVLMNGQTPLVVGDKQYAIDFNLEMPESPVYSAGRPLARIVSSDGTDITDQTTGGKLGALVDFRNRVLPSYMGDATQAGSLNTLARQLADSVNDLLTSGYISDEDPPEAGVALFTYDTTNESNIAASLAVDSSVTADQLAAIEPGPPSVSNGIPLALAALADPSEGTSLTESYGDIAADIGHELDTANDELDTSTSIASQAKTLREQTSGVSLNDEAVALVQYQKSYEAISKLITVLNSLLDATLEML